MGSLNGSLDSFAVTDVLQLLARNGATGALRIDGPERAIVYCMGGAVTRAACRASDGLGEALVRAGLVSAADLQAMSSGGKTLSDVLGVDSGRRGPIVKFLRHQTEETLFEISQWPTGHFRLDEGETHALGDAFTYPILELLDAVQARIAAWPEIQSSVPSLDSLVAVVLGASGDDEALSLTRAQFRAVSAADGTRSVREVALSVGDGLFETAKAVAGLVSSGLVRLDEGGGGTAVTPAAVASSVSAVSGAVPAPPGLAMASPAPAPAAVSAQAPPAPAVAAPPVVAPPAPAPVATPPVEAPSLKPAAPTLSPAARAGATPGNGQVSENGQISLDGRGPANGSTGGRAPSNGLGAVLDGVGLARRAVNGSAQPTVTPQTTEELASEPPPAPATPEGLPVDFAMPGGRPDRGLVLKLLSAVKELQVDGGPS